MAEGKREVLVHLNVEVPEEDGRGADEIAQAVERHLKGHNDPALRGLEFCVPLAEEV